MRLGVADRRALAVVEAAMVAAWMVAAMQEPTVATAVPTAAAGAKEAAVIAAEIAEATQVNMRIVIVSTLGVLILAALFGGGYFYLHSLPQPAPDYSKTNLNSLLINTNQAFARGEQLMVNSPKEAALAFQQALTSAQDPIQEGQIKLKLGVAYEKSGNYPQAVSTLKDVAANPAYSNLERAYAVQELGMMYYTYGVAEIRVDTFSSAPFSELAASSTQLSYRHLFEYGSAFYPLAYSELRIADWYASDVQALSKLEQSTTTMQTIDSEKAIIKQKLANARKDIARIKSDQYESQYIGPDVMREAVIVAKMQSIGDVTFGDMESLFQQALDFYSLQSKRYEDGFTRYYYASYLLALSGQDRIADVRGLLAPFYSSTTYTRSPVESFLRNERTNETNSKNSLIALAKADPKFKQYLISLGWGESDFKTQ